MVIAPSSCSELIAVYADDLISSLVFRFCLFLAFFLQLAESINARLHHVPGNFPSAHLAYRPQTPWRNELATMGLSLAIGAPQHDITILQLCQFQVCR